MEGLDLRKQMVPEIDCIRSGIRCKKAGERRGGVCRGMGGFGPPHPRGEKGFLGWGVRAGEGFEEGLDCIHGGRVAGGVGFGQWVDVRGGSDAFVE